MSLIDLPRAFLDRIFGRDMNVPPDDPILRRLERSAAQLDPDPLYRRRLRGDVLNRYVAAREGLGLRRPTRRSGALGRAVLFSSVALAVSVTAAGAASQGALPGDVLYPMKRELEEIRLRIAPPWVRGDLLAAALAERLGEVEQLARAGRWELLPAAVDAAVATEAELTSLTDASVGLEMAGLQRRSAALQALLSTAPDLARPGLARALQAARAAVGVGSHRVSPPDPKPNPAVIPPSAPGPKATPAAPSPAPRSDRPSQAPASDRPTPSRGGSRH